MAIPARDEARRLPSLFAALAAQRAAPRFTLLLLLDRCDDGSAAVAARLAPLQPYPVETVERDGPPQPNAGSARAYAAERAIGPSGDGFLLISDADSAPAPDWIAANLAALAQADVALGRIVRRGGAAPLQARIEAYYDRLYDLRRTIDPVPWEDACRHHWTSGASLALRFATYRALGGFPPIPHGEDAALVDRACRQGLRVRRDARIVVRTSARRHGRARDGFAAALRALDRPDAMPSVSHPEDEAWRYRYQAIARAKLDQAAIAGRVRVPGVSDADMDRVLAEVSNGEAFAARIVGAPPGGMRTVPLAVAERALDLLIAPHLAGAA